MKKDNLFEKFIMPLRDQTKFKLIGLQLDIQTEPVTEDGTTFEHKPNGVEVYTLTVRRIRESKKE